MTDAECVRFLQWALPRLRLRWPGLRRVRTQVCKRLARRMRALGLSNLSQYRAYLERIPDEWAVMDGFCRITISRFYRDRDVFEQLCGPVLHMFARRAQRSGESKLEAWSIGCASGEEPYSLALCAKLAEDPVVATTKLHILATDVDPVLLARARTGCYPWSSLKDLPHAWLERAFAVIDKHHCLRPEFRQPVELCQQDIRSTMPHTVFHLILCRNLIFTYFAQTLQETLLQQLLTHLLAGGVLVVGKHESLPRMLPGLEPLPAPLGMYRYRGK
jgi:chemotaxis protein methyltransferase CheR